MLRQRTHIRIAALFVVAFICLNAGGAACVAYCQTFDLATEPADHCPLKKSSEHCDRENNGPSFAELGSHDLDCCPMTVSFFAGPVEKLSFSVDFPAEIAEAVSIRPIYQRGYLRGSIQALNYRGPPLIDRRTDRLKHCIIRI